MASGGAVWMETASRRRGSVGSDTRSALCSAWLECRLPEPGRLTVDHERSKDVFFRATELPAVERKTYLDEVCAGDEELRREVDSLLAHLDDGRPVIETVPPFLAETAAEVAPLDAGDIVAGRYRVDSPVGQGGMAWVYRVRDLLLDIDVALKLLRRASLIHRDRLFEEVRLARRVSHPAVCRVYDAGEHDGACFLTMELVDGEDLSAIIDRDAPLSSKRVIDTAGSCSTAWRRPTTLACCTAISSRATSSSIGPADCGSPTSVSAPRSTAGRAACFPVGRRLTSRRKPSAAAW